MTDDQIRRTTILVACELARREFALLEVQRAVLENLFGNPSTTLVDLRDARDRYEETRAHFEMWCDAVEFGARELTGARTFLGARI